MCTYFFQIWLYVLIVSLSTPMPTSHHFFCIQKERKSRIAHTWTLNMALYLAGGWMKAAWPTQRLVHLLLLVLCVLFLVNERQCQHRWSVTTGFDSRTYRASGQWVPVPTYKGGRTGERRRTATNQTWPFSQHYRLFLFLAMLSREIPFFFPQQRQRQWRWTISTKTLIKHC